MVCREKERRGYKWREGGREGEREEKDSFICSGKDFIRRNLPDCKVYSDSNFVPIKLTNVML